MGLLMLGRQNDSSVDTVEPYSLTIPSSVGSIAVPSFGGKINLNGKDSKIHVVDYAAGSTHVLYSTAEIMTWLVAWLMHHTLLTQT